MGTPRNRWLAAEHGPDYDADRPSVQQEASGRGDETAGRGDQASAGPTHAGASELPLAASITALCEVIADLAAIDVDGYDDTTIEVHAAALQRQLDRLTTRRDLLFGVLRRRAVARAAPGREQRAEQQATRRIAQSLDLTPSEAKQAGEAGRVLTDRPELAAAAREGALRPEQATLIGRLLRDVPPAHHDRLREELVAAAGRLDAVQLGRLGRRRLAQLDQQAAVDAEDRRHARRRAALVQTAEGTVELSASLSGLDAEVTCTAIDAFRTPDPANGPGRTAEQRTADALTAALRASLDLGTAPTNRRVRPHLLITVPAEAVTPVNGGPGRSGGPDAVGGPDGGGGGVAEAAWTGPHPVATVRHLLDDATRQLLGIDHEGLPIALSHATEQPTAALYLALAYRDEGCRWPGCDAPATWCDVAHATARRDDGPVTIHNTLLLCRRHHRQADRGGWTITIDGNHATFTHRSGRSLAARPVGPADLDAPTGPAGAAGSVGPVPHDDHDDPAGPADQAPLDPSFDRPPAATPSRGDPPPEEVSGGDPPTGPPHDGDPPTADDLPTGEDPPTGDRSPPERRRPPDR